MKTFFDIEVANTKNCSICQIGLIIVEGDNISKIKIMVNPNDEFDRTCSNIHHITKQDVVNEKNFKEVWKDISHYFINNFVFAHNALSADINYLIKNLVRYKLPIPNFKYICTKELCRKYIPNIMVESKYDLQTLCQFYNIDMGVHHDALDDAFSCYQLYINLKKDYDINIEKEVKERIVKNDDLNFILSMNKHHINKSINTLYGLILGINADHNIVSSESEKLRRWLVENDKYKDGFPFNKIIPILNNILEDNIVSKDELNILLDLLDTYSESTLYSETTLSSQILLGYLEGIIADNQIDQNEIEALQLWLYDNIHLKQYYPFNRIFPIINHVLDDKKLTQDEQMELMIIFKKLINPITEIKENLIRFEDKKFCLTGEFQYGAKSKVNEYIESKKGICVKSVTRKTDFLIVGGEGSKDWSYGNYGVKVKKAIEMINKGHHIKIFCENDLFSNLDT